MNKNLRFIRLFHEMCGLVGLVPDPSAIPGFIPLMVNVTRNCSFMDNIREVYIPRTPIKLKAMECPKPDQVTYALRYELAMELQILMFKCQQVTDEKEGIVFFYILALTFSK